MRVNRHLAAGLLTTAAAALVVAPMQAALATQGAQAPTQQFADFEKMTPQNAEALLTAADKPTISIFSNEACSACHAWAGALKKKVAAAGGTWRFVYIDTDVNPGMLQRLGGFELTDLIGTYKGNYIHTPYRAAHGEFVAQWISYFLEKAANPNLPFRAIPGSAPATPYSKTKDPFPSLPGKPAKHALPKWNDTDPRPAGEAGPANFRVAPHDGAAPGEHTYRVITDENYDALLEESKNKLVILDFSTKDCVPCRDLEEILHPKINADKGDWIWGMMDGLKYRPIWEKYHKPWFPTMIAIRDGKEVVRRTGYAGDADAVITWIDTLRKGEVPEQELMVMDATSDADMAKVDDLSTRHPVALRFHNDKTDKASRDNGYLAANMANTAGGKWTLVNIDRDSDYGKALAAKHGIDISQNVMVVYYNKSVRLEPLVGLADSFDMSEWVGVMLSTKYPENKPTPAPTSEPTAEPSPSASS